MRYEPQKANEPIIEGYAPPTGSIENIDPVSAPIPGQSLTVPMGSQKFEKPWVHADPDDAVMFVIDRIETNEELRDTYLKQMASGVPVEYLVNTVTFVGFSEGLWSPDTAELIKPPLALYFIQTALEHEVPVVIFNPESQRGGQEMSDEEVMASMSKLNPEAYEILQQRISGEMQEEEPAGFLDSIPMPEEGIPQEEEMALPVETMPEGGML